MSPAPIKRDALRALTDCGVLLDLKVDTRDRGEVLIKPRKPRRPRLCWSDPARAVVFFTGINPEPARDAGELTGATARAAAVWEKWTDDGREAGKIRTLELPNEDGDWTLLGSAVSIGYRSDKYGGQSEDYEHAFGDRVQVHWFQAKSYGIVVIRGGALHVTKDGIAG